MNWTCKSYTNLWCTSFAFLFSSISFLLLEQWCCSLAAAAPSAGSYFSIVMMKAGQKPRRETMKEELMDADASDNVAQYVSIKTGAGGFTYIEVCSLTTNLHGKQDQKERDDCRDVAEKHGLVHLSIAGVSSYLNEKVSVLYEGTAECQRLVGDIGWDIGVAVQGMYQLMPKLSVEAARKLIDGGRGNLQQTFGISNHNYNPAKAAETGEVAALDVQNETNLHKYFPNRGRDIGIALAKLAAVRDALAKERGSSEYGDEVRNQFYSGRTGNMFGLPTVGFENVTVSLTGCSRTLEEMVEALLLKLDPSERFQAKVKWGNGRAVETEDHGDNLNPTDDYSRVVLGKWRIHLLRDREGEVLGVTLIGNHRAAVGIHRAKMKGIRGLGDWIRKQFKARADEAGHTKYEDDGDFVSHGGIAVQLGFVADETEGIKSESQTKYGAGGFVSYSRPLSPDQGPWRRHRNTILEPGATPTASDLHRGPGGERKRKRDQGADPGNGQEGKEDTHGSANGTAAAPPLVSEEELAALRKRSTLHGELRMKQQDPALYWTQVLSS